MITVHTAAGESRIVQTDEGVVAIYAGVDYDAPARSNELWSALDLIELVLRYEGLQTALAVAEALRPQLAGLGYELQEGV